MRDSASKISPFSIFALAVTLAFFSSAAHASLILSSPDETSGTGLGAVNTVLTMQATGGETTESGCVGWDGSMDVVGPAACPPGIAGGDETAINETRTLGELGIESAFNLRVVFNYNETQSDPMEDNIRLQDLVLTIYSPAGAELFNSGPFDPRTFPEPFSGTGNAGFVYRLDTTQALQAQAFFDDPQNRIGLAASATGVSSGPETFFVADASAVQPAAADLEIVKTDSEDPVARGAELTYTLEVTNNGPNNATGVRVVDTLPAGVTFVSADPSQGGCVRSGRTLTCDLGSLGDGQTATIAVTVTAPDADRTVTNTAAVSGDQSDPDGSNNTAREETEVGAGGSGSADLSVRKSDNPDPVTTGGTLTYTVVVENSGPDEATGVTLTDDLPAGVTFVSATSSQGSCSQSGGTVTCDLGSIAADDDATVTIEVTAPASEGTIVNRATVSGNESDPNPDNNSDSEQTEVEATSAPAADLRLEKTDSPDPVTSGGELTYTLTVTNLGPGTATGVNLTDNLPASVTFVDADSSQGSCVATADNTVSCELGALADGETATVTITVTAPEGSGTLTNTANVGADPPDPDGSNNDAVEQTRVDGGSAGTANLSVVKNDSPDPVAVGGSLTYTLTIANAGPDAATEVRAVDTLPGSVTVDDVSASQGGCSVSGRQVVCELGTIDAGDRATVTITVTPASAGVIVNSVSVSAAENDPNPSNNSDTERTVVGTGSSGADLAIEKVAVPDPVEVGELLTFDITVENQGPGNATGVEVSDTLPVSVDFESADATQGSCDESDGVVTCQLGALAAGETATVKIVVVPTEAGMVFNTASVSANESDPSGADNSDSADAEVEAGEPPPPERQVPALGTVGLVILTTLLALMLGVVVMRRLGQPTR